MLEKIRAILEKNSETLKKNFEKNKKFFFIWEIKNIYREILKKKLEKFFKTI